MNKLIYAGRIIFALGIIGLAILGIIYQDFIVGRPPAFPERLAGINPTLAYVSASLLIIAAVAIIFRKYTSIAALVIAALVLCFSVMRHLPVFMNDWVNAYKSMAIMGGALIIAGTYLGEPNSSNIARENWKNRLTTIGMIMLAAFFIAAGYAHFKWAAGVKELIPTYIPFRLFWAYFCGVCLFAGGVGILIPQTRKWAALLSGIMVLGWFFLLHIPRFLSNTSDRSDRLGVCESFLVSGIFFVLAGLFSRKIEKKF